MKKSRIELVAMASHASANDSIAAIWDHKCKLANDDEFIRRPMIAEHLLTAFATNRVRRSVHSQITLVFIHGYAENEGDVYLFLFIVHFVWQPSCQMCMPLRANSYAKCYLLTYIFIPIYALCVRAREYISIYYLFSFRFFRRSSNVWFWGMAECSNSVRRDVRMMNPVFTCTENYDNFWFICFSWFCNVFFFAVYFSILFALVQTYLSICNGRKNRKRTASGTVAGAADDVEPFVDGWFFFGRFGLQFLLLLQSIFPLVCFWQIPIGYQWPQKNAYVVLCCRSMKHCGRHHGHNSLKYSLFFHSFFSRSNFTKKYGFMHRVTFVQTSARFN